MMTLELFPPSAELTSFAGGSPANRGALPENSLGQVMNGTSGLPCPPASQGRDPLGLLERTLLESFAPGLTPYSMTWKTSVTPGGRSLFRLALSAPRKSENGSGLWPTPSANEDAAGSLRGKMQWMLTHAVKAADSEATAAGGQLNPQWVAWLMGFPVDWLDLKPSETPSSRKSSK